MIQEVDRGRIEVIQELDRGRIEGEKSTCCGLGRALGVGRVWGGCRPSPHGRSVDEVWMRCG